MLPCSVHHEYYKQQKKRGGRERGKSVGYSLAKKGHGGTRFNLQLPLVQFSSKNATYLVCVNQRMSDS